MARIFQIEKKNQQAWCGKQESVWYVEVSQILCSRITVLKLASTAEPQGQLIRQRFWAPYPEFLIWWFEDEA